MLETFLKYFTHEQCDYLRYQFKHREPDPNDFWIGRLTTTREIVWRSDIRDKILGIKDILKSSTGIDSALCFPHMVVWPEGHLGMPPHSDYGAENEFPYREFAAVILLSDEHEGGDTIFPGLAMEISLSKGDMILFSGGKYMHAVGPIYGANRYTCIMWFSDNSKYDDPEPVAKNFYHDNSDTQD